MVVLCLVLGSSVMSNKGLGFESRAQRRPNWCFGVMITSNHTICSNLLRLYIYIYEVLCFVTSCSRHGMNGFG